MTAGYPVANLSFARSAFFIFLRENADLLKGHLQDL